MKYEIPKNYFDKVIFELIYFNELFRLNGHTAIQDVNKLAEVIDILRYYRQFSK